MKYWLCAGQSCVVPDCTMLVTLLCQHLHLHLGDRNFFYPLLCKFGSDLLRSSHYLTHHLQLSTVEAKISQRPDQLFPRGASPAHLFAE